MQNIPSMEAKEEQILNIGMLGCSTSNPSWVWTLKNIGSFGGEGLNHGFQDDGALQGCLTPLSQ